MVENYPEKERLSERRKVGMYTGSFQNAVKALEDKFLIDPSFKDNIELQDKFVQQLGFDPDKFFKEYEAYDLQKELGQTEFRPKTFEMGGEFAKEHGLFDDWLSETMEGAAGFALRTGGRGVTQLLGRLPVSLFEDISQEDPYQSLRDYWLTSESVAELIDPYHGTDALGITENIIADLLSFYLPFQGLGKLDQLNKAGKFGPLIKKAFSKLPAKVGAVGVATAATEALIWQDDMDVMNEIIKDPDGLKALEALDTNPEDREATNYINQFLKSLKFQGLVLGGGGAGIWGLIKGYKAFKKSRTGERVFELGDKWGRKYKEWATTRRGVDDTTFADLVFRNPAARALAVQAEGLASDLKKSVQRNDKELMENYEKNNRGRGRWSVARQEELKDEPAILTAALGGDEIALASLTSDTRKIVDKMRLNIDDLSKYLDTNVFAGDLSIIVGENLKSYINRSYRIFDEPAYRKDIKKAARIFLNSAKFKNIPKETRITSAPKSVYDQQLERVVQDAYDFIKRQYHYVDDSGIQDRLAQFLNVADNKTRNSFFDLATARDSLLGTSKATGHIKNIPKEIKALWGEVKSPYKNYVNTFSKLGVMKAEHKFMSGLAERLKTAGIAKEFKPPLAVGSEAADEWTLLSDIANKRAEVVFGPGALGEPIKGGAVKRLREAYPKKSKKDVEDLLKIAMDQAYIQNPVVKQLYVSPSYRDALMEITKTDTLNKFFQIWARTKGFTQLQKTVFNPATHGRNTFGNMIFMVANGMNPIGGKGFNQAWDATMARISGQSNEELSKFISKMISYGIADSNVTLGLVKQNLKRLDNQEDWLTSLGSGEGSGIFSVAGKVARVYEGEDFLFKVAHYMKSLDYLKRAHPELTKTPNDLIKLERMAAERTRDLMPNYHLVPKALKALRYMPIGDFAAFPAEVARITKNLIKYTFKDMTSGNQVLMNEAFKRTGGITAAALMPDIMQDKTANIMGISEAEQQAIDVIDNPFYQGSSKLFFSPIQTNSKGGKQVDMFRFGPVDPFDSVKVGAKLLHQAFLSNNLDPVLADKSVLYALDRTLSPFFGSSMLTDMILELNDNPNAAYAYPKHTLLGETAETITSAFGFPTWTGTVAGKIGSVFEPGFATFLKRRFDFEKAQKAQIARDLHEGKDPTGEVYNRYMSPASHDFFPEFVGLAVRPFDITGSVNQNIIKPLKDITTIDQNYVTRLKQRNIDPSKFDDLLREYDTVQKKRYKEMLLVKALLEVYKDLGFTEEDIRLGITQLGEKRKGKQRKSFYEGKRWGEISDIMHNIYSPTNIAVDLAAQLRDNTGGQFDTQALFRKEAEYRGLALD